MNFLNTIIPRYTSLSFPAYKHQPKLTPHPTRDPGGHSFGKKERFEELTPSNWKKNESFLYGIDLYNHAYWWEAHEFWEGLWQLTDKQALTGRFLQGLIQLSAALLKKKQKMIRGVHSLSIKAIKNMEFVLSELDEERVFYCGIDIKKFFVQVTKYFAPLTQEKSTNNLFIHQDRPPIIFLNF